MPQQQPTHIQEAAIDPRDCLYISDLDGTLLSPQGAFSCQAAKRINDLIDRGLKFTIATARNYDSAYPLLQELNLKIPVILFNGVYLTDFHSGENILPGHFLEGDIVDRLIWTAVSNGLDPFIYTYGKKHNVYYRNVTNEGSQAYVKYVASDGRLRSVEEYRFPESENVSGLLLIDTYPVLEPVYQEFLQKNPSALNIYFAEDMSNRDYHWLQVFHHRANKGNMVALLADHLGMDLAEVVVFGDFINDLEMFQVAGRGIAVSNAIPEVIAVAHEVIGSNSEDAVIDYLESLGFDG